MPLAYGGFQQAGLRPGTEPVALAAGLQVALEYWQQQHAAIGSRLTALRDEFETLLSRWLAQSSDKRGRRRASASYQ